MIVYSPEISSRLRYIAQFTLSELGGQSLVLTSDLAEYQGYAGPAINYSHERIRPAELWMVPYGLLTEKGIIAQHMAITRWNRLPVFFQTKGDLPFDFFSAAFYLISRYEEYLPHQQDIYGRYAHTESLAFREGFLHQPLVNQWLSAIQPSMYSQDAGFCFTGPGFRFLPTYDIDEAYAYQHKGWVRNTGGLLRDFFTGATARVRERLLVLTGKKKDPYDSMEGMREINTVYQLSPVYFFLVAAKNAGVDKNILPHKNSIRTMIKMQSALYATGLHPSWQSGDQEKGLQQEKKTLEEITGNPVTRSRQHFIRFTLPGGYRRLIENGISEDYSMGYGSINGFRASVAASFLWYDLEKEETTGLRIFPFCFMDANSFYEQHQTAAATLEEMRNYYQSVNEVNGLFSMIWHNTFLGTDKRFAGWRGTYTSFLQHACIPGK